MTNDKLHGRPIILIAGPTAVGKTSLAIDIAERFNGEIINGDSMQVYQELSIGTAKPTFQEQQRVPHHLIDTHAFYENYDMNQFKEAALEVIKQLHEQNKLPIIVGGSGLYLQSLLEGYHLGGLPRDPQFYEKWQNKERKEIFRLLGKKEDDRIPTRRLLRQLELFFARQKRIEPSNNHFLLNDAKGFILTCERSVLYERINQRVDLMIDQGLLKEAQMLYDWRHNEAFRSDSEPTALKAIGYKELFPYLEGIESLEASVSRLKQATRRYAKRQLTWFRNRMPYLEPVDLITQTEGMSSQELYKELVIYLQTFERR